MTGSRTCLALLAAVLLVCTAGCSTDPATASAKAKAAGDRLFEQRKFAEATLEYRSALKQTPMSGEVRLKLAESLDQLGDGGGAMREYVRAADLLPGSADAQLRAGVFLLAARAYEDAKVRAQNALGLDPKNVEAHLLLAEATAMMSQVDAAVQEVEKTIQMEPSEPRSYTRLGRYQFIQGDREKAEASFKRAVDLAPTSADALRALAQFYLASARPEAAEEALKKAVELSPNDPQANRALAAVYLSSDRRALAEGPLKAYAEASPTALGHLTLADYYFAQKRAADARQVLDRFRNDEQFLGAVQTRLAVIDLSEGRSEEAFKRLDAVLAKSKNDLDALVMKGRFMIASHKYDQAVETLSRAVDAAPESAGAHYYLGVAYLMSRRTDQAVAEFGEVVKLEPTEVSAKIQLAQIHLSRGRYDVAASLANEAVRLQPRNGQARMVAVEAMIARGEFANAEKDATLIANYLPKAPEPQLQLARLAMRRKDLPTAERHFARALELSPRNTDAISGIVNARMAAGRTAEAQKFLADNMAADPTNASLQMLAASVSRAQNDTAGVERALLKAVELDPDNLTALGDLAQIHMEQQRYDEARQRADELVRRDPSRAVWGHTLAALSYERQNRKDEARQRYEQILGIDPRAAMAANNLAMLYLEGGQNLDLALNYAQTAKVSLPNAPQIDDTLGQVYHKRKMTSLAIASFKEAVAKDATNAEYAYHLGLAYEQGDNMKAARDMWQRALKLSSTFPGAADARARLSAMAPAEGATR